MFIFIFDQKLSFIELVYFKSFIKNHARYFLSKELDFKEILSEGTSSVSCFSLVKMFFKWFRKKIDLKSIVINPFLKVPGVSFGIWERFLYDLRAT